MKKLVELNMTMILGGMFGRNELWSWLGIGKINIRVSPEKRAKRMIVRREIGKE